MTTPSPPPFAPLPVRARTTLEIFDTAFKLFRRYAGVLLGWAFLSSLVNLIPLGSFAYVLTLPLFYGAVSCVIAAAVRGQNVRFGQVWGFTKARYGAMVGVLILAGLMFLALMFGISMGVALLSVAIISLVGQFGTAAAIVAWIIGVLGGLVLVSLFLAVTVGWFTLAPIVACLEDQHRGSSALSRALSLLSGSWRKACAISVVTSLALGAAMAILGSVIALVFYGGFDKFVGANASDSASLGLLATSGGFSTIFLTFSMPVQTLIIGVFYLDLRTRKEALDLEWTNYAAQPEPSPEELAAQSARPMMPTPPTAPLGSLSMLNPAAVPPTFTDPVPTFSPGNPGTQEITSSPPPAFAQPNPTGFEATPPAIASVSPAVSTTPPAIGAVSSATKDFSPAPEEPSSTPKEVSFTAKESTLAPKETALATESASFAAGETSFATGDLAFTTKETSPTPPPLLLPSQVPLIEDAPASPPSEAGFARPSFTPPPIPPTPPAVSTPSETSSFAPPRRAEPDEDPDFPSSFGGGGRR